MQRYLFHGQGGRTFGIAKPPYFRRLNAEVLNPTARKGAA
jgi:hypothetical protein